MNAESCACGSSIHAEGGPPRVEQERVDTWRATHRCTVLGNEINALVTERDSARNLAAKLEAELATKDELLRRAQFAMRAGMYIKALDLELTTALVRVEVEG